MIFKGGWGGGGENTVTKEINGNRRRTIFAFYSGKKVPFWCQLIEYFQLIL